MPSCYPTFLIIIALSYRKRMAEVLSRRLSYVTQYWLSPIHRTSPLRSRWHSLKEILDFVSRPHCLNYPQKRKRTPINKLTSLRNQVWPNTTSRDNNFQSFVSHMCTIPRNVDSFNGVTEPDHLMFLDSFFWRYCTISPHVTG